MDKHALFLRTKSLWPHGVALASAAGKEALNNIYWRLEKRLKQEADDWLYLAAWAFHQALWELVDSRSTAARCSVRPDDVPFDAFDRWMRRNLCDESWAEERKEYDRDLG